MTSASLLVRGVIAVALMIGFYLLAIAIAVGAVYIPYAEWQYGHRLHIKLAAVCIGAGFSILWAILPRRDRFEPPGPELRRGPQRRLFALLDRVSRATGQSMPAQVYLVPDVNAFVTQRGGVMGVGSHRVMGVGLPLLQALSVSQLAAVLAHEFGRFHGGDTALGPWIYKTRAAIGRTLGELGESLLSKPFELYGKLFLRITQALSRRQEFAADRLAASIAGPKVLAEALRKVHGSARGYDAFWQSEVAPMLGAGFRPPLATGFAGFMGQARIAQAVTQSVKEEIVEAQADPYDTHPPLRDRIAALQQLPAASAPALAGGDRLAVELLDGVDGLEIALLDHLFGQTAKGLQPLAWDDAGERVWLPSWRQQTQANREALEGLTPARLPALVAQPDAFAKRLALPPDAKLSRAERAQFAESILAGAVAVALAAAGHELRSPPGAPVEFRVGQEPFDPFESVRKLLAGKLEPAEWERQCRAAGIWETPLAAK